MPAKRVKKKKRAAKVRAKRQSAVLSGISGGLDVLGIAGFALIIFVLLLLLGTLWRWFRQDIAIVFSDLGTSVLDAVLVRPAGT